MVDLLFIAPIPSFYKIDLYNRIAESKSVYVIFIAEKSTIRQQDFTIGQKNFDYCVLNERLEDRRVLTSCLKLIKVLRKIQYKQAIVGGWDCVEFWWFRLFAPNKTALALESSEFESHTQGVSGWLKKQFVAKLPVVYASGEPHARLLKKLQFNHTIIKTRGVGLFRYEPKTPKANKGQGQFLYVGRLAPEKNLPVLLAAFKNLPQYQLTLIGEGPEKNHLANMASDNVTFLGYVANEKLSAYYQAHDVFILPSVREPWGLVVEEALYYGLPVIVSDKVGCREDLVEHWQTGLVFDHDSVSSLEQAIISMMAEFPKWEKAVAQVNFKARDEQQIACYQVPR